MADLQAAVITQLRNIQTKTGKSISELLDAVSASGLSKHGERRSWLMERYKLGHGDANTVVHFMGQPLPAALHASGGDASADSAAAANVIVAARPADPLDELYAGSKAHLRPLHEAVMALMTGWGDFEIAPKKTYLSLRRKKQFAMLGPATQTAVELGLNAKDLADHPRLKRLPPGGMCQATTRISQPEEVDAQVQGWLKQAFDAAG